MPEHQRTRSQALGEHLAADEANPAAPPPMPTSTRLRPARSTAANATPANAQPETKPADEPAGGWDVDPEKLDWFADAVESARRRLRLVQDKVTRMQSDSYSPHLGTSPVAQQLERKFADRLDAAPDDPRNPTGGGLRPLLAEAIRRMDEFIAGAEAAARSYRELDESAAARHSSGNLEKD